jgi:hypothetical protein
MEEPLYYIDRTSNPVIPSPIEMDFSKIVEMIKMKIKKGIKEYHFRPYCIDGVYCYIVLYLKQKILTIESINIKCYFNDIHTMPYVLYHKKYKSIDKIVQLIHKITTTYKIISGDLLSTGDYNDMKTEEILIPYNENEVCCVCLENTTDNTTCGHFICLRCRDKCIIQKKKDCPICRSRNVLPIYSNTINLINNVDYTELYDLFYDRIHINIEDEEEDDDGNSIVSSSSEEEEEEEEDEDEEHDDLEQGERLVIIQEDIQEDLVVVVVQEDVVEVIVKEVIQDIIQDIIQKEEIIEELW